jgi:hypothetical protein
MNPSRAALKTSWIAIIGTFLMTWLPIALWVLVDSLSNTAGNGESFGDALVKAFPGSLMALLMYGFYLWVMLSVSIVVLDMVLFKRPASVRALLLTEWGVIGAALVCMAAIDNYWMFAMPVIPLLLAQLYREKKMKRMIGETAGTTGAVIA